MRDIAAQHDFVFNFWCFNEFSLEFCQLPYWYCRVLLRLFFCLGQSEVVRYLLFNCYRSRHSSWYIFNEMLSLIQKRQQQLSTIMTELTYYYLTHYMTCVSGRDHADDVLSLFTCFNGGMTYVNVSEMSKKKLFHLLFKWTFSVKEGTAIWMTTCVTYKTRLFLISLIAVAAGIFKICPK